MDDILKLLKNAREEDKKSLNKSREIRNIVNESDAAFRAIDKKLNETTDDILKLLKNAREEDKKSREKSIEIRKTINESDKILKSINSKKKSKKVKKILSKIAKRKQRSIRKIEDGLIYKNVPKVYLTRGKLLKSKKAINRILKKLSKKNNPLRVLKILRKSKIDNPGVSLFTSRIIDKHRISIITSQIRQKTIELNRLKQLRKGKKPVQNAIDVIRVNIKNLKLDVKQIKDSTSFNEYFLPKNFKKMKKHFNPTSLSNSDFRIHKVFNTKISRPKVIWITQKEILKQMNISDNSSNFVLNGLIKIQYITWNLYPKVTGVSSKELDILRGSIRDDTLSDEGWDRYTEIVNKETTDMKSFKKEEKEIKDLRKNNLSSLINRIRNKRYSRFFDIREVNIRFNDTVSNLYIDINNSVSNSYRMSETYIQTGDASEYYLPNTVRINQTGVWINNQIEELANMELRDTQPLKYINNKYISNNINEFHCVDDYLYNTTFKKKISRKSLTLKNRNVNTIQELLTRKKTKVYAYDCNLTLIKTNVNEKIKWSHNYKQLVYMAHDNHMYIIPSLMKITELIKKMQTNLRSRWRNADDTVPYKTLYDLKRKMREIMKNGYKIDNVSQFIYNGDITSFEFDSTRYVLNPEYEISKKILENLGIPKAMKSFTNLSNIYKTIEKLYINPITTTTTESTTTDIEFLTKDIKMEYPNYDSFIPQLDNFSKGGYFYEKENAAMPTQGIDINKAYTSALRSLPHLQVTDIKIDKISLVHNNIFSKLNAYLFTPIDLKYPYNIAMQGEGVYDGLHIYNTFKHLHIEDIDKYHFKIEGISTDKIKEIHCRCLYNYFPEMIKDLYSKLPKDMIKNKIPKEIINRMVGHFQSRMDNPDQKLEFVKMCNEDEVTKSKGYLRKTPIGDRHMIFKYVKNNYANVTNRKLIAFQVINKINLENVKKILKVGILEEDLINIKTDAINFIQREYHKLELSKKIGGWDKQEPKLYGKASTSLKMNSPLIGPQANCIKSPMEGSMIYDSRAGCGKSYTIIEALMMKYPTRQVLGKIPDEIRKNGFSKNNLIYEKIKNSENICVLSAQAASLHEHRVANLVDVFTFDHFITGRLILPKYDVILIDEMGLMRCSHWDMLYKLHELRRLIIAFGDFTQLLPVKSKLLPKNTLFLNLIFEKWGRINKNYRNNFTQEYYDHLCHGDYKHIEEIEKYSIGWKEAETIICYTNETKNKYNKLKMEYLNQKMDSIGCKVICITNKNNSKLIKKYGIYNRYRGIITDKTKKMITVNSNEIPLKVFYKYFEPNHSTTVYGIQGSETRSFHYPSEDYKYLKWSKRVVYTIISRLKVS